MTAPRINPPWTRFGCTVQARRKAAAIANAVG